MGPIGLLCGLCGKDKVKSEEKYWLCNNCGSKFTDCEALSTSGGVSLISNNSISNTDSVAPKAPEMSNMESSSQIDIPAITYGGHRLNSGHIISINGKTFYDSWGICVDDGIKKIKITDKGSFLLSDGESVYGHYTEKLGKNHIIKLNPNTYDYSYIATFTHSIVDIHMNNQFFVFSNDDDGGKLYRMNKDGTNVVKLADDKVSFITIWNEWIYYINNSDKKSIYKIKLDGSAKTKIYGGKKCQNLVFDGKQLYFTVLEGLLKTNLFCIQEGGSSAKIIAEDIDEFVVTDTGIFITSKIDDEKCAFFMSYNNPQKKDLLLKAEQVNAINVDGGYLYYGCSLIPAINKRLNLHNGDIEQL